MDPSASAEACKAAESATNIALVRPRSVLTPGTCRHAPHLPYCLCQDSPHLRVGPRTRDSAKSSRQASCLRHVRQHTPVHVLSVSTCSGAWGVMTGVGSCLEPVA